MRHAGFAALGITAESASDPVLDRLEKGFDAARVREVAQRVSRVGLRALWIFLVGGPGETPATLDETLAFAAQRLQARGRGVHDGGTSRVPGHHVAPHCARRRHRWPTATRCWRRLSIFPPDSTSTRRCDRLREFARRVAALHVLRRCALATAARCLTRLASVMRLPRTALALHGHLPTPGPSGGMTGRSSNGHRDAAVIVVGAGPAGAATAWALARAGVDVLLLDRARFPRDKPCAEYLSPQASRILADMGVLGRDRGRRRGAA